jgi:hypothetical protein
MNTTTQTDTVNLADYYFTGQTFHWPNIAVTLAEWPLRWRDEDHSAGMSTDTRDIFWLRFKDIELFFGLKHRTTVHWNHAENGLYVTTPLILPKDPVQLLQFLELTSHPEARDIAQFWLNLQKFLPFLSRFEKNVAWH